MDGLWEMIKHQNRETEPSREIFLDYMFLLLTNQYNFHRVAFYEVEPEGHYAKPILVIGPDTKDEHSKVEQHLNGASLDKILNEEPPEQNKSRASPTLAKKFYNYKVPLNQTSRFSKSHESELSFFGIDEKGYSPTEVDQEIKKIFGTDHYALITVKGRTI